MKDTIGLISGLLVCLSMIPYAVRTCQKKIQPNFVSWFVWAVIGLALLLTYRSSGATSNAWVALFGFINPVAITILTYIYGNRDKLNRVEKICLIVGLITIIWWWFIRDNKNMSQYALYVGLFADAFAAIPTIYSVWRMPDSDRPFAWLAFSFASFLNMFAIEEHTIANYALPVYMTLGSASIALPLIIYRLKNKVKITEWA